MILLTSSAYAQEHIGCDEVVLYNWIHKTRYAESWNKKYIAIGDIEGIRTYAKNGKDYIYKNKIETPVSVGTELFINENGILATLGDSFSDTQSQSETIDIYNINGKSLYKIQAKDILSKKEIEGVRHNYESENKCPPKQPWICWSSKPYLEDNILVVNSALGHEVHINIESGKILKKADANACEKS